MGTYAGIGSRETPENILQMMTEAAILLGNKGYLLRSGGAVGADRAFEAGALEKEIYTAADCTKTALELASRFHPAWDRCSVYAKQLHGRNALIILGKDLVSPVDFVVCWTPRGKLVGGTGQALRIANDRGIRVFNLCRNADRDQLLAYLGML